MAARPLCCGLVRQRTNGLRARGSLASAAALAAAAVLLWITWHLRRQTDFLDLRIYRNSIEYWRHGHSLYDFEQPGTKGRLGFTYPPFAAMVLAPLTVVSESRAEHLVLALNLAICAGIGSAAGIAFARRFAWPAGPAAALGTAMVLSLEPVRESLGFGQINIVLLALVSLDLGLLAIGRRAGIGIGLAAAIKLTPVVLILALLAAGRRSPRFRQAGRRALATAGAATVLAAVALPASSWRYWTQEVWATGRVGRPDRITNQSWTGVLCRMLDEPAPSRLLWLAGAVGAVAATLMWAQRATGWWTPVRIVAVAAAAATFASPISWTHHYWWAALAVAALLYRAAATRSAWALVCFAAVLAMFVVGPIKAEQWVHHWEWASALASDLYLYATVLTVIGLVVGGPVGRPPVMASVRKGVDAARG